ncbi:MAG TPA: hypothetical protein VJT80_01060 [Steroidobacteraceae bacterium]|nr:hypothetical protein [Steroidobacteraceae bacterium]
MSRAPERCDSESDHRFHRTEWRVQRIGWVLVALFLVLAFAGLFGNGPLSRAHADNGAGRLEYQRFTRFGLSTDLVVTPAASAHGVIRVEISSDYLEAFRVEHVTPEPAAVRLAGPNIIYEFASGTPGASISFHITPQRLWRRSATITIDGGAPLRISQLTYP